MVLIVSEHICVVELVEQRGIDPFVALDTLIQVNKLFGSLQKQNVGAVVNRSFYSKEK